MIPCVWRQDVVAPSSDNLHWMLYPLVYPDVFFFLDLLQLRRYEEIRSQRRCLQKDKGKYFLSLQSLLIASIIACRAACSNMAAPCDMENYRIGPLMRAAGKAKSFSWTQCLLPRKSKAHSSLWILLMTEKHNPTGCNYDDSLKNSYRGTM